MSIKNKALKTEPSLSWAEEMVLENFGKVDLEKMQENQKPKTEETNKIQRDPRLKKAASAICEKPQIKSEKDESLKTQNRPKIKQEDSGTKIKLELEASDANKNVLKKELSDERDISLDFIGKNSANEEKFERLIKEEKLQTSFKRRHSGGSSVEGSANTSPTNSRPPSSNRNAFLKKRTRHGSESSHTRKRPEYETNVVILERRQKQIDYGKNTLAYDRYVQQVPRFTRTRDHPQTPNKNLKYSRRAFDGLVKIWRKQLHFYDDKEDSTNTKDPSDSSELSDSEEE